ncbi:MAG: shikimate dehydrogenase [Bacteroidetes bacterium]|nr:shikimate dehydrogenase [Bacteroidota bacterium]
MKIYGLIGNPLKHSYSRAYFEEKFAAAGLSDHHYELFPLQLAKDIKSLLATNPNIAGLNVTIPFKRSIMKYIDILSVEAEQIGAVNCIRIDRHGNDALLKGYNTDAWGFEQTLKPLLKAHHTRALILGTGGSAHAVGWVLKKLGIGYLFISRKPYDCNQVGYSFITPEVIGDYPLIINATPLGMFPDVDLAPAIPYSSLTEKHLLFDLIYNPDETLFLKRGKEKGATICNGLKMLHSQADKAWDIWNA